MDIPGIFPVIVNFLFSTNNVPYNYCIVYLYSFSKEYIKCCPKQSDTNFVPYNYCTIFDIKECNGKT